jgi:hypothetical protein
VAASTGVCKCNIRRSVETGSLSVNPLVLLGKICADRSRTKVMLDPVENNYNQFFYLVVLFEKKAMFRGL